MLAGLMVLCAAAHPQGTGVIREIIVRGNVRVTREAILAAMRTKAGQPYLQSNLDQDKAALEGMGFFQAVDVRAEAVENDWRVVVDVSEWPEIKEIRVTGNKAVPTDEIIKAITIKPGEIFNLSAVNPSRTAIIELYRKRGYLANIADFAPLAESPNTLNVAIVETRVASVTVEGNERTNDRVIKRLIKTRPGDPLNVDKWQDDLRRLYGTQWFETVESDDEPVEMGQVALTVRVKEQRTGTLNVGVQMDPRSSFAGFLRLGDTNFRGTGQTVGINLIQSSRGGGTSIDLDYANPFIDDRDTSMSVSAYSRVIYRFTGTAFGGNDTPTDDNQYIERRTGGAIGFSRPVQEDVYASIATRIETIKTSDLDTTASTNFIHQDGDLATITLGVTRNKRDVDIDPSSGNWVRLEIEPGFANIKEVGGAAVGESALGRNNYVKSFVDYRTYFTNQPPRGRNLSAPRRVLAARLRYGRIDGRVPFFEQFFAGGSDTLRGYEEDRFWGKEMVIGTLEYRMPIQRSLSIVMFADYGSAWGGYGTVGDFSQTNRMDLRFGYGLGLSVRTPLGPIRLDLGFNDEGKSRLHFLIGTAF